MVYIIHVHDIVSLYMGHPSSLLLTPHHTCHRSSLTSPSSALTHARCHSVTDLSLLLRQVHTSVYVIRHDTLLPWLSALSGA